MGVNTRILLTVFFAVVLTPVGIVMTPVTPYVVSGFSRATSPAVIAHGDCVGSVTDP